jgi:hypothetical protein
MNRNVYATILIILAIGLYFTVTQGIFTAAGIVKDSNNQYVSAIESAKKLISVRDKVLADYNSLSSEDRDRLNKIMPNGVDNIRLIIDMNNIASQHGFSLKGIKASASGPSKNSSGGGAAPAVSVTNSRANIGSPILEKVTVGFSVSAPYQQFISFLQDLESSLRIMDVTHLSVSSSESGVYDWNVELQTYWLRSQ